MLKTLSALCAVAGLCTMLAAPGARATPATEIFIQLNVDKGYMILNSVAVGR